ncbi:MAG: hypothetical protein ACRC26_03290 [Bacteroidales bacterium]
MQLLEGASLIDLELSRLLIHDCDELRRMLISSIRTSKNK